MAPIWYLIASLTGVDGDTPLSPALNQPIRIKLIKQPPLKAYLTEPLPWMPRTEPSIGVSPGANETFAAFEARALAFYTSQYTSSAPSSGVRYVYDATNDVDVLCGRLQHMTEASFSYAPLPGAFFYSKRTRLWVRDASLGTRNASSTALVQPGTLFGRPSSIAVLWIDAHDSICFAVQLDHGSSTWLYCKLGFRMATTLLILSLLWSTYYVHYRSLAIGLRQFGTCGESERLEIIVGDPTCLILQNTWICVLFVVDFWCSLETAGQCIFRIDQTADKWAFALSTLYLSRTVWFGYLVLNLSGYVLRRCGLESRVAQADPTGVAIGVALVVGPLTYYQLRLSAFIDLYHVLYTAFLPPNKAMDYVEHIPPAILYTIVLGALPLVYSFAWPALIRLLIPAASLACGAFARSSYNDWKHRLLLGLIFGCGCCRRRHRVPKTFRGGSIYKLFTTHRHLQRNAAFSFRGSDCYVLSHTPTTTISYRLSLSDALLLDHRTDIVFGSTPTATTFGRLIMNPKGTIDVQLGAEQSRWIM
ncbi:hypothetical protein SPRG_13335 [Saprolegnia parasitica CBS 223.65]|uniref:Uncharacterized protein n=1 Tax=Saprolegnia parasitica (strain CBS 223.65) TaxID=695850 RepID=A0A067BR87_SAPPC|nr:hypothetical protein SPRG_13335 [Saprolegnia parasitica CBS 223.65]KDO20753.1 hypothetical protein SPRG_13335 [Saprolegnia parasitica CBS 223.65]|eukprot:XP_012208565.1 hypothetical protein SPRG_13335 [Saprolegnia parasitica CBS 223.65]